jgi:hypothetical protein
MTKIAHFNSNNINSIRAAIDAKLQEVSQEYGIALTIGGMRYNASEITTRLTVKAIGSDTKDGESIQEASDRVEFARYAQSFGLKPEFFGQIATVNGKDFRIVGIKPRSRKFPILGQEVGGDKVFKLTASSIKSQLEDKFAA